MKGDLEGVNIVDIACRTDCALAVSDSGDVFGWGNSEYSQLSMVTEEMQVNVPKYLSLRDCGKVKKVGAGGSICMLLNGRFSDIVLTLYSIDTRLYICCSRRHMKTL